MDLCVNPSIGVKITSPDDIQFMDEVDETERNRILDAHLVACKACRQRLGITCINYKVGVRVSYYCTLILDNSLTLLRKEFTPRQRNGIITHLRRCSYCEIELKQDMATSQKLRELFQKLKF